MPSECPASLGHCAARRFPEGRRCAGIGRGDHGHERRCADPASEDVATRCTRRLASRRAQRGSGSPQRRRPHPAAPLIKPLGVACGDLSGPATRRPEGGPSAIAIPDRCEVLSTGPRHTPVPGSRRRDSLPYCCRGGEVVGQWAQGLRTGQPPERRRYGRYGGQDGPRLRKYARGPPCTHPPSAGSEGASEASALNEPSATLGCKPTRARGNPQSRRWVWEEGRTLFPTGRE